MLGWELPALIGRPHADAFALELRAMVDAAPERRGPGGATRPVEVRSRRPNGSPFDLRASARRIAFEGQTAAVVSLHDISELKIALRAAEWHAGMLARTEALCRAGSCDAHRASGRVRMSAGLRALLQQGTDSPASCSLNALD